MIVAHDAKPKRDDGEPEYKRRLVPRTENLCEGEEIGHEITGEDWDKRDKPVERIAGPARRAFLSCRYPQGRGEIQIKRLPVKFRSIQDARESVVKKRRLTNQAKRRVPAGAAGRPPDTRPLEREVRQHEVHLTAPRPATAPKSAPATMATIGTTNRPYNHK